jgi:meso-butanediol dehydrogenase/(S,S)-butanediol dehydrogenase/diacetyl reductase
VLCADLDAAACEETAESIRKDGGRAVARACDVRASAACGAAVEAAVAAFGRLDALCNVAGVGLHDHATAISDEQWQRVIDVNLSGTFYACRAAIPHLLERRGAIVNMASSAGLVGVAYSAAYCASKGGVVLLTRSLAVEYGKRGLRANCVCPGGVDTPLTRAFRPPENADRGLLRRMALLSTLGSPADVAGAVAYLASDEARYVNGAVLSIDGGQVA